MNMIRKATLFAAACLAATTLTTNGFAADTTLRLGLVNQPTEPASQGSQRFADLVAEKTDGRIEIQVFPAGQLGNNRELFTQLTTGAIELAIAPYGFISDAVPEYSSLLAGYFYDDWDDIVAVLEAEQFGQAWNERLIDDAGLRVLDSFYYGTRQVTMNDKAPTSPEEFAGIKLRSVPNPMSLSIARGLGAEPTPVPFPELFQALRQGTVDGQENPLPTIHSNKFYEVQNQLVLTGHQRLPLPWIINEEVYQSLSPEDQQALEDAAAEAAVWTTELNQKLEGELTETLAEEGMTVVEISDEQRAVLAEAVQAQIRESHDGSEWPAGFMDELLAFVESTHSN
ncbi:MAG: TRAP transporter substrate-binding protein [Pseudomonadota bacterium]